MTGLMNYNELMNECICEFSLQVNASVDVLQLFEISKLCDGVQHCYQGSDEDHAKLKCTSTSLGMCISSTFRSSFTCFVLIIFSLSEDRAIKNSKLSELRID